MSNSTHQIKVKGVDATGKAFDSIAARAKATGASIRAALGGAIAAAGAYLSFRSIKGGIDELGNLSDMAMKAGTSVEFLTESATAFQVAGLNLSAESLTKAMQMMQKNTGQQGEKAFFEIAKQIAAIPDEAERAQAAVKVFGGAGQELLPLVNNGAEAIEKFKELKDIMPGVSQAAAQAGNDAAKAMEIATTGIKSLWLEAVGKIASFFEGGLRGAAIRGVAYFEYFARASWRYVSAFFKDTGNGTIGFYHLMEGLSHDLYNFLVRSLFGIKAVVQNIHWVIRSVVESILGPLMDLFTFDFDNMWSDFIDPYSRVMIRMASDMESDFAKFGFDVGEDFGTNFMESFNETISGVDVSDLEAKLDKKKKLSNKRVNDLAGALGDKSGSGASTAGESFGAAAAKAISNKLILAGSNESRILQVMGPQVNEAKKQTSLLEKIAKNTEKTAENTEEGGEPLAATDLS